MAARCRRWLGGAGCQAREGLAVLGWLWGMSGNSGLDGVGSRRARQARDWLGRKREVAMTMSDVEATAECNGGGWWRCDGLRLQQTSMLLKTRVLVQQIVGELLRMISLSNISGLQ
ncbi:hypothetical protein SLEP1_g44238 [Rubroshorea leprosula]|uniref:Uncharacterized protein n=1 Tax=Rubroshorea leprosula TaxID=152421 RepID=A0AAV5LG15_9ROSI|nr:hypothetical protein SLEP1_g44238 [Rubroshorea leprosula]